MRDGDATPTRDEGPPGAALRRLLEATANTPGEDPLRALVRQLAAALAVRCALVTELVGPARARTLAFWLDGRFGQDFAYALDGSPCEQVFAAGECWCPRGVQQQFPRDADLVRLGLASYHGVVLRGRDGRPLGHLAVLDGRPTDPAHAPMWREVLADLGARAAAELERRRGEQRPVNPPPSR